LITGSPTAIQSVNDLNPVCIFFRHYGSPNKTDHPEISEILLLKAALIQVSDYRLLGASG